MALALAIGSVLSIPLATTASAQCVTAGSTVTCSNNVPGGFGTGNEMDLTINVQSLATVGTAAAAAPSGGGISVDQNNVITNLGTVADQNNGISAFGTLTVNNLGTITTDPIAGNAGIFAQGSDPTGGTLMVTNSNLIEGGVTGISNFSTTAPTIIINSGTISGPGFAGVTTSFTADITNNGGTISGGNYGVFSGDLATIVNGGAIVATGVGGFTEATAIFASSTANVSNSGSIISQAVQGFGIFANFDVTVTNSSTGAISGAQAGIISSGCNVTLTNAGTVTATGSPIGGGSAVSGLEVSVTNSATGLITASGSGAFAVSAGDVATVVNAGTITASGFLSTGVGAGASPFANGGNAIVTNSGTISAAGDLSDAIFAPNMAIVVNSGTISTTGATTNAIEGDVGVTVTNTNTGVIQSDPTVNDGTAIFTTGLAKVTNSGTIIGGAAAISALGCGCGGPGTADVTNSGTIASTGVNSIAIGADEVILSNSSSGTITGKFAAVLATDTANVTNSGTISASQFAILASNQITLTNSGVIQVTGSSPFATAISTNGSAQIVNNGLISGVNGILIGGSGGPIGIASGDQSSSVSSTAEAGSLTLQAASAGTIVTASGTQATKIGGTVTASGLQMTKAAAKVAASSTINKAISSASPRTGFGAAFLMAPAPSTVTNNGTISITGGFAVEIFGNGSTVTNNGTITTNSFAQNVGIALFGDSNTAVNNGLMQSLDGNGSFAAIFAEGNSGTFANNGTIILRGQQGVAIGTLGDNTTITNTGTIQSLGKQNFGLAVNGNSNTIINSGVYLGGGIADDEGIVAIGNGNKVINSGKITVVGQLGAGIDVAGFGGTPNTILNSGTVTALAGSAPVDPTFPNLPAAAIFFQGSGTILTNTGSIVGGQGTFAIQDSLPPFEGISQPSKNSVINTGTIDGVIDLSHGTNETLTNGGLITISYAGGGLQHVIGDAATNSGIFTQTADGTLALRILPNGVSDQLIVNGTANLGGTLKVLLQPGNLYQSTVYKGVVDPPVLNGTFAQTLTNSFFFSATPIYNAASVDLNLTRTPFNAIPGLTRNEFSVATALEGAYSIGLTGAARALYSDLFVNLTTSPAQAYDMLGGEGTTATQQSAFDAQKQFSHAMGGQGADWATGGSGVPNQIVLSEPAGLAPLAYADQDLPYGKYVKGLREQAPPVAPVRTLRIWGSGFAGLENIDSVAFPTGSAPVDIHDYGANFGADYQLNPNFLIGAAAGGSGSTFSVDQRLTTGTVDGMHVGIYGATRWNAFYASADLSYGRFSNAVRRGIIGIGPNQVTNAKYDSDALMGRLELGYRYPIASFVVTPFAAIEASGLRQAAFTETDLVTTGGFGVDGLTFRRKTAVSLPTSLGAQVETDIALPNGFALTPFARLAWVHEFRPERNLDASFTALPAAVFSIDGARVASDALEVKTGAKLKLGSNASLFANFEGELAGRSRSYTGMAGFNFTW